MMRSVWFVAIVLGFAFCLLPILRDEFMAELLRVAAAGMAVRFGVCFGVLIVFGGVVSALGRAN